LSEEFGTANRTLTDHLSLVEEKTKEFIHTQFRHWAEKLTLSKQKKKYPVYDLDFLISQSQRISVQKKDFLAGDRRRTLLDDFRLSGTEEQLTKKLLDRLADFTYINQYMSGTFDSNKLSASTMNLVKELSARYSALYGVFKDSLESSYSDFEHELDKHWKSLD